MRRLAWLTGLLFSATTLTGFAQSYPEVEVLIETALAKDAAVVTKHLPSSLQKTLADLPVQQRQEFLKQIMVGERLKNEGVTVARPESGDALLVFEKKSEERQGRFEIRLDKRITDGAESVLRLKAREFGLNADNPLDQSPDQHFEVWMRFEDGEWHIFELMATESHSILRLDDPNLIDRARGGSVAANEASAVGSLRIYNTALVTYEATYTDLGYPNSLEALGDAASRKEPDATHAMLIDQTLSTPPYQRSGYRFSYRSSGTEGYTIVGRPIQFGTTGTRSFFTDQTGVIRYTEEDREPTENDSPLQ